MSDEIQADGTIESLKTVVNTIKTYAIPEYPENELGQVPFIRAVLDAVVSQVEASIARQETDRETAAANEKYIFSMQALCRGEEVTCALHVSQPIHDLRQQLATLTQERDALREENTRLREYIGVMDAALKIPDGASTTAERCKRTNSLIGSDDWMEEPACSCVVCIDHVLTPSGEAGKGGEV